MSKLYLVVNTPLYLQYTSVPPILGTQFYLPFKQLAPPFALKQPIKTKKRNLVLYDFPLNHEHLVFILWSSRGLIPSPPASLTPH